jgi:hypothetical protein
MKVCLNLQDKGRFIHFFFFQLLMQHLQISIRASLSALTRELLDLVRPLLLQRSITRAYIV